MRYSDAFDKLYALTLETSLETEPKHERIGLYICNVLFVAHYHSQKIHFSNKCYVGKKDIMVEHVCGLTDSEWDELQVTMCDIIKRNKGNGTTSLALTNRRFDWVSGLDTLRAFS